MNISMMNSSDCSLKQLLLMGLTEEKADVQRDSETCLGLHSLKL